MKKLKILTSICLNFLIFTYSFSNNFKFVKAFEKKTNSVETKIEKNNELENIQKITLKIPEKNPFMRGLIVVLTEEKLLKDFLENLKITAELDEQKASFFDVIFAKEENLKNFDGVYITYSHYENSFEKEKAFKKTKDFLNKKFEKKLENLKLKEKDIEKSLVKLGTFANSAYQSEKNYFENLKNEKKQIISNNLKSIKTAIKNKDKTLKILELIDKDFAVFLKNELKNKKNWEEKLIKNFKKEFLANLEKEAKENVQKNKKLLKEFLKFISGQNNVEEIFEKYEKIEKQESLNSNKLENFYKKLFKNNEKRNKIIKNLKKCVKNIESTGLKEKQFENKTLEKHEIISKLSSILNLFQNEDGYSKLENLLKDKGKKQKLKKEINFIKSLNSKIKEIFLAKKIEKNKQKIFTKDLDKLEKTIIKLINL